MREKRKRESEELPTPTFAPVSIPALGDTEVRDESPKKARTEVDMVKVLMTETNLDGQIDEKVE